MTATSSRNVPSYIGYAFGTRILTPSTTFAASISPMRASSSVASATASSCGSSQVSSPSKQKYSTPRHVVPGTTRLSLHAPKFCTRPAMKSAVDEKV